MKRIKTVGLTTLISLFPVLTFAHDIVSTNIDVEDASGLVIEDQVVVKFNGANSVVTITDLGLPSTADIAALHYVNDTTILFTLKSTAQLDSVTAKTGDVMQWSNGNITTFVSSVTLGLSLTVGIDALTQNGSALIFSTDIANVVNGVSVTDSDLLIWSVDQPTELLLDQSECGIPDETDLSGVHITDTGQFLMTFSSTSEINGVPTRKGDIMRCDPGTKTVTLYRRFSDLGTGWASVGLDAISQSSTNFIFSNGFESQ